MLKHSYSSIVRRTAARLLVDALTFVARGFRSRSQLAAENLFRPKQLALCRQRLLPARRSYRETLHRFL
jgi:hypothetical protein